MQGKALKIVYERFYERFNWRIRIQLEDWFSKRVPKSLIYWWAVQGSNLRPPD